jgi:UDPglucose 6-dehydrogenase
MGLDDRIGPRFLHPGPGFGGSCFPKDTRAVVQIARDLGLEFRIVEAVLEVNRATRERMVAKVEAALGGVAGKTLGVLGLSFKPDTDDVRVSPAIAVARGLVERGAKLKVHDPEAMAPARADLPDAEFCADPYAAAEGAEALVILTEWNQFRALDLGRLKRLMRAPVVVDLRNIYEPAKMAAAGFRYLSVGRVEAAPETTPETTAARTAARTAAEPAPETTPETTSAGRESRS